ncbi:MAG TPA: GNAT family N-acetyltransferase [Acidimicrobiia bacterium]|nr:GNAT family N-acetyltransferase [Acidimicrobiia bacterium]
MIEVRLAGAGDLPEMHRIWWATGSSPGKHNPWFAHVLRTGRMVVAVEGEQVVGFAGHRMVWQTNVISDCFVDPACQGVGIGTAMLTFLLPPGEEVMTLASDDPKAHSLYRRWGMRPVVDCPYLQATGRGDGMTHENDTYPIPSADLPHLQGDLGCQFVRAQDSLAAITEHSIESSLLTPGDDPIAVFQAFLGRAGTVELQMGESHPAFGSFECKETFRDTLMATPDAQIPDPRRITYNGDLLAVGY